MVLGKETGMTEITEWDKILMGKRIRLRDFTGAEYLGQLLYADRMYIILQDGKDSKIWIARGRILSVHGPLT